MTVIDISKVIGLLERQVRARYNKDTLKYDRADDGYRLRPDYDFDPRYQDLLGECVRIDRELTETVNGDQELLTLLRSLFDLKQRRRHRDKSPGGWSTEEWQAVADDRMLRKRLKEKFQIDIDSIFAP